jgi:hypothetical protein
VISCADEHTAQKESTMEMESNRGNPWSLMIAVGIALLLFGKLAPG